MTNEQPEPLRLADALEATHPAVWPYGKEAAAMLRRLYAENEALKAAQYECGFGAGCCYQAAKSEADEALLRQALEALTVATLGSLTGKWKRGEEVITAIKERLK